MHKDKIKQQSSYSSLFRLFINSGEFCICYKKLFHCDKYISNLAITEEKSASIFTIDEEDCNFNYIYNHRFSSYSFGCPNCIKNEIDYNAYVILSDINLPNF